MRDSVWNTDTLLNISVNLIPLFIIGFFVVAFLVFDPWGGPALGKYLQIAILIVTGLGLALLTHQAAVRIESDE